MADHPTAPAAAIDPTAWVDQHGDALFRFALFRVGRAELAEDLVQETFLAAWRGREAFAGRSSERTWLMGILKNKIADHLRRRNRDKQEVEPIATDILEELFDDRGHWRNPPPRCTADPAADLERAEFHETLRRCLGKLPGRWAAAFCLREMDGLPSEDVREALGVSAANLWTLLHRARLSLCRCLDLNWFGHQEERP
jgi:RNA polymerase sigma-70 factor (TIGR02943 family)